MCIIIGWMLQLLTVNNCNNLIKISKKINQYLKDIKLTLIGKQLNEIAHITRLEDWWLL